MSRPCEFAAFPARIQTSFMVWRPLELEVEMKRFSVSLSLVFAALCAGCATEGAGLIGVDASTGEPRVLYCKDGAYVTKSMGCAAGVERVLPMPTTITR